MNIFPSIVHCIDIPDYSEVKGSLIGQLLKERALDPQGLKKSNCGGWHSRTNLHQDDNSIVKDTIFDNVAWYFSSNKILKENSRLEFTAMWTMINGKDNYNEYHMHSGSDIAGVFWIKTPEDCGNLYFNSPHAYSSFAEEMHYSEEYKKENNFYSSYWLPATEGRIIMFPSSLYHSVKPNQSGLERISVSFNITLSTDT